MLDRRRRKADLVCHRHAVSHAYTTGDAWHQKSMQEFDASNRQWLDRKAALLWDMWRSLNEELAKLGKPLRDMPVGIGWQHAAVLHLNMRCSVKSGVQLPTEQDMLEHLKKFRDDFIECCSSANLKHATRKPRRKVGLARKSFAGDGARRAS